MANGVRSENSPSRKMSRATYEEARYGPKAMGLNTYNAATSGLNRPLTQGPVGGASGQEFGSTPDRRLQVVSHAADNPTKVRRRQPVPPKSQ